MAVQFQSASFSHFASILKLSAPTCRADLPVDPPRPFLRLDVDIIVIDINLGNLHLEVIGKEPDRFPHRAEAGTPWRLKQRGWGGRAWKEKSDWSEICHKSYLIIDFTQHVWITVIIEVIRAFIDVVDMKVTLLCIVLSVTLILKCPYSQFLPLSEGWI